jgi:hypothetical protein
MSDKKARVVRKQARKEVEQLKDWFSELRNIPVWERIKFALRIVFLKR